MSDTFQADADLLAQINGGVYGPSNPYGLNGAGGPAANAPRMLNALGRMGPEIARLHQESAAIASSVQAAGTAIAGMVAAAAAANDLAMGQISQAVDDAEAARDAAAGIAQNLAQATTTAAGIVRLATPAEFAAGADDVATTPADLSGWVPALTAEATADDADLIPIHDAGTGAPRKMTRADFLAGVGGGGARDFTASGSITAGKLVALAGADTVSQVAEYAGTSVGSAYTFEAGETGSISTVYDTTYDKVVAVYKDAGNSSYLTVAVMSLSQDVISIDGVYSVASVADAGICACSMGSGKVFIAKATGSTCNCYVFDVGSATFSAASSNISTFLPLDCSWDAAQEKALVIGWAGTAYSTEYAVVVPVTGTTIGSPGSLTRFNGAVATRRMSCSYDTAAAKHLVMYSDETGSTYVEFIVATISGTTPSFGSITTAETIFAASTGGSFVRFDPISRKHIALWNRNASGNGIVSATVSVSGTSATMGTITVVETSAVMHNGRELGVITSASGSIILIWRDYNNNYLKAASASIIAENISVGSPVTVYSSYIQSPAGAFVDAESRSLICFADGSSAPPGLALSLSFATSNAMHWIGIADSTVANGQSIKVNTVGGFDTNQTGLTADTIYYAADTGGLTSSPRGELYRVGRAVNTTTIHITGSAR